MRVFREAAGIYIKGDARCAGNAADLSNVGHRYRLPAAGVVRDGHHDQWDLVALFGDQLFQGFSVDIAFERVRRRQIGSLPARKVKRCRAVIFDICTRRIEVCVVRDYATRLCHDTE